MHETISPYGDGFTLAIGPLCYRLLPCDAWGTRTVNELAAQLAPPARRPARYDRTVLLCARPRALHNRREERPLPGELAALLPAGAAGDVDGWCYHSDLANSLWIAAGQPFCVWTGGIDPELGNFRYHLPWQLILHDMQAAGGGLIHGGLAAQGEDSLLLLAPPGGGKSTTLATAPGSWQVPSDDAALIWPGAGAGWLATPLPSWGMLNRTTAGPTSQLKQLDHAFKVSALVRIFQAQSLRIEALTAATAAPLVYRALCEYPGAFLTDPRYRRHSFRLAAELARQLPCRRLELPLGAEVWPQLEPLLVRASA